MFNGNVVVVGGGGFYGRYLVDDLLTFTNSEIIIVGRNLPVNWTGSSRVRPMVCDMNDLESLERLVQSSDLLIHCAGPFQALSLNPLHAAIRTKTNYIDIAETRNFLMEVRKLEEPIRQSGISVLSGLSVVPGMEALFAEMFCGCFDKLLSIRTFAAPDTRKHRGPAMFQTMLSGVGQPFWQPGNGKLRLVHGWTEPEWVEFAPPLGKRLTYLVLEMADLDLLPELFGVQTVEFKAGTEQPMLNRMLGLAANVRKATGLPNWERFAPLVRAFSWMAGKWGKDEGGVIFEFSGMSGGSLITHQIAINAQRNGGLIPSILASIAATDLLSGSLKQTGLVALHKWIESNDLITRLQSRTLDIWLRPHDARTWFPYNSIDFNKYKITN